MNVIQKLARWTFDVKRKLNPHEKLIRNTYNFSQKNKLKIIYKKLDFLTIKLNRENSFLYNIENTLVQIYIWEEIYNKDVNVENIYNKKIIFDKFFIIYWWIVYWWQKKLYDIYDYEKNKIWQIVLKNLSILKKNKNVIDSLELTWLFFKSYEKYLNDFINLLWINTKEQNIVKRLDYCVDFKWLEVFEFIPYIKDIHIEAKEVTWLTATDFKKIHELKLKEIITWLKNNSIKIRFWKKETYIRFWTQHNDLKIYDKILDLLQPKLKKRKVDWINPYQDYLDSDNPITRIELKKKKFYNIQDNSLDFLLSNIEALFFDYLLRYFSINLSLYVWENVSLNWKELFLAKEKKEKSIYHSYIMAQAYLNNIKDMVWDKAVYKFLYQLFPELENTKPLDLVSEMDLSDYFNWFTDDIINLDYNKNELDDK